MERKLPKGFNERWYLKLNPDVEQEIIKGSLISGAQHYLLYGYKEKRKYKKPIFYGIKKRYNNYRSKNKIINIGNNNTIECDSAILTNTKISISGNNNHVIIKNGARLNYCSIIMNGDNHYLEIGHSCNLSVSNFRFEDYNCSIVLKDQVTTIECVDFCALEPYSKINIGKDCMFSSFIELRTSDSHTIYDINTNKRENYAKDISIGNHVWVGAHSNFLKGSVIPDNCIIAMRAMVTKQFNEPNCIIGGFPAKIINRNKNWKRERTYD